MKVMQLIGARFIGCSALDYYVLELARQLSDLGHEAIFVFPARPSDKRVEELIDAGGRFVVIPRRSGWGNVIMLWRIMRVCRANETDVIVGQFTPYNSLAVIIGILLRIPAFDFVHGCFPENLIRTGGPHEGVVSYLKYRVLPSFATKVVGVSNAVVESIMRETGLPRQKCTVLRNGIDPKIYRVTGHRREAARTKVGVEPSDFVVVACAQLVPQKGLAVLIQAARMAKVKRLVLLICGEGPLRSDLENALEKKRFTKRVRLLGYRNDVPDILAAADAAVLSSLGEGFPLFVLEAMATGLPVVATRVGGVPEAIEDQVTGILVEPGKPGEIARALERLASEKPLARVLGQRALRRAKDAFNLQDRVQEEIDMYKRALARRR